MLGMETHMKIFNHSNSPVWSVLFSKMSVYSACQQPLGDITWAVISNHPKMFYNSKNNTDSLPWTNTA